MNLLNQSYSYTRNKSLLMYETMDACNIKPIMSVESSHKSASIFGKQFYENSICYGFSDSKGLSAVKNAKEPQLITSDQPPGNSSYEIQEQTSYSITPNYPNPIQYQPGLPNYPLDASAAGFQADYCNLYQDTTNNTNVQYFNSNSYAFNEVLNIDNSNCFNSIANNNNFINADQEDEFESVINPRSKSESPTQSDAHAPSSCPLYIEPFANYSQQTTPYSNPQIQSNSEMTTMMIPTFSLDFINTYNYLPQDTDDAFASVIYNTPPQLKPVLYSDAQSQSALSHFYENNYNFNSYGSADASKQSNMNAQSPYFTQILPTEKDKNFSQSDDQSQPQNKNSCMNSPTTKHRQRVSSNEYKRYRSPATLIIQFPTLATTNGSDLQKLPTKSSSGASISVSSERRARTRKVSSSPSLVKPSRNNFIDIDIDDKKPVINFKKPTISSSNDNEKNNRQSENKKNDSVAKTKIRGRK